MHALATNMATATSSFPGGFQLPGMLSGQQGGALQGKSGDFGGLLATLLGNQALATTQTSPAAAGPASQLPPQLCALRQVLDSLGMGGKTLTADRRPLLDNILTQAGYSADQRKQIFEFSQDEEGNVDTSAFFELAAGLMPQLMSLSAGQGAAAEVRAAQAAFGDMVAKAAQPASGSKAQDNRQPEANASQTGSQDQALQATPEALLKMQEALEADINKARLAAGQKAAAVENAGQQAQNLKGEAAASLQAAPAAAGTPGTPAPGSAQATAAGTQPENGAAQAASQAVSQAVEQALGLKATQPEGPAGLNAARAAQETVAGNLPHAANPRPGGSDKAQPSRHFKTTAALDAQGGRGDDLQPAAAAIDRTASVRDAFGRAALGARPEVVLPPAEGGQPAGAEAEASPKQDVTAEGLAAAGSAREKFQLPGVVQQATTPELAQQVAHQVARALTTGLRRGEDQIKLRLRPPELGELHIDFSLRGDDLKLVLVAESKAARDALQAGMPELRGSLAEQGVKLGEFSVFVRQDGPGYGSLGREQGGQPQQAQPAAATEPSATPKQAGQEARHTQTPGRVDVFC